MNIQLPASKSIGARFLVATYFAGTLPADPYFDDSEDLMVLQQALLQLYSDEEPIDYGETPIDVNASGTAYRFVTAVCASSPGADFVITGIPRLMERPISPLVNLLKEAGAVVNPQGANGNGPLRITGKQLSGGEFKMRGDISSQFISAVMLVAPYWEKGVKINFSTSLVSKPYLEMTAGLMGKFGIKTVLNDSFVEVAPGKYIEPEDFKVEADWSGASFFYEACALGAGPMAINSLLAPNVSLQGDSITVNLFRLLGVFSSFNAKGVEINLTEKETKDTIEFNFNNCPDLVLPFSVACLLNDIRFKFSGVRNLRLKESDRIESLKNESIKYGFIVKSYEDTLIWEGEKKSPLTKIVIDPHGDHRVAMAFAMTALKTGSITIANPNVVEKSFVRFWEEIHKLGLETKFYDNFVDVVYHVAQ